MFKGFYNLTSAMLTHQQNLNVVGNNMTNISTAGYKQRQYTATTFDEVMYSRLGNKDGKGPEIGEQSYIRATSDITTDFRQGSLEPTGIALDFAINGDGFFAVADQNGDVSYTREGNFSLTEDGYLCLGDHGRVLNTQGNPIYMGTDKIRSDGSGGIYTNNGGFIGRIGIFNFAGLNALTLDERGMYHGEGATARANPVVLNGYLERSNTNVVKQMADMIAVQRSFQSAAQVSKIYDQLMTKATTELGHL